MKKISIIGFGRFGKTLYRLLKDDFEIVLYDKERKVFKGVDLNPPTIIAESLNQVYESDTVFFCVPISSFEKTIVGHKKYFRETHLLVDVLSVKLHPKKVFEKYLKKDKTQALLTHPMFGPDSSKNGFSGLPIVIDQFLADHDNYCFWKEHFQNKGLRVVEMSADEHDRLAANSQGLTHFIGRLLEEFKFSPTPIDTLGSKKLQELVEQTCNDSWELFLNLQNYNPYAKNMRIKLEKSFFKLLKKLIPPEINKKYLVFGIQGGIGSFNEQALLHYLKTKRIIKYKIRYLYTSYKVLSSLNKQKIDFGLFAIHNSVGGIVGESIEAMAQFNFKIIKEFSIPIQHFLMKRKDTSIKSITIIMAHPQVFRQCHNTLQKKYPYLKLESGKGDLVDTARAAQSLSQGKLSKNRAILGPQSLANLYNLDIIDSNLQDDKINNTYFLLVGRKG